MKVKTPILMRKTIIFILGLVLIFSVFSPMFSLADTTGCGTTPTPAGCLSNPLSGISSLYDFVTIVLNKIVLPIGAVIVVFFIIYSGFLFVTAQGSEDKLKTAKTTFLYTVIGAAVLLGSVAISFAIKGTLCAIAPSTLPAGFCTT